MAETYGDWVSITNSATADAESAASAVNIQGGARIIKIMVFCVGVGQTYAVKVDCPSMVSPQKYLVPGNGQVVAAGGKWFKSIAIDVDIPVPRSASSVNINSFADVASATCKVGLEWSA